MDRVADGTSSLSDLQHANWQMIGRDSWPLNTKARWFVKQLCNISCHCECGDRWWADSRMWQQWDGTRLFAYQLSTKMHAVAKMCVRADWPRRFSVCCSGSSNYSGTNKWYIVWWKADEKLQWILYHAYVRKTAYIGWEQYNLYASAE